MNDSGHELSPIQKWVLFSFGVLFIVLPLIGNLIQLHYEIKEWMRDTYSAHTIQPWIRSYLRLLYMMAILFGSAFAAVDICNSNIFHLQVFNMGLNKRQRAVFKNGRVLSTVLCENIPQLILQTIYLSLTAESSISVITILSMIFSTISILSSIFDFVSSSLLLECEAITVIELKIESTQLANMGVKEFRRLLVHHRKPIRRELAKITDVDWRLVEILIPIQTKTGAKLTLYIRNDSTNLNLGATIVKTMRKEIETGKLAQVGFLLIDIGLRTVFSSCYRFLCLLLLLFLLLFLLLVDTASRSYFLKH